MKSEKIFKALSCVDQELLERSEQRARPSAAVWMRRLTPVAAFLGLIAAGTVIWTVRTWEGQSDRENAGSPGIKENTADQSPAQAGGETSDAGAAAQMGDEKAAAENGPDVTGDSEAAAGQPAQGSAGITAQEKILNAQTDRDSAGQEDLEGAGQEINNGGGNGAAGGDMTEGKQESPEDKVEVCPSAPENQDWIPQSLEPYFPTVVPKGYQSEGEGGGGADSGDASVFGWRTWSRGLDTIHITVYAPEACPQIHLIEDISRREYYDVGLYEIPYADSVPEKYRETMDDPTFHRADLSLALVGARMKAMPDSGDTSTPQGNFNILFDDGTLVCFRGRGETDEILKMLESIGIE